MRQFLIIILILTILFACGQSNNRNSLENKQQKNNKDTKMNTSKLTNETVKKAFVAWQNGDSKTFLSYFTADAKLTDDGSARDFKKFVKEACGHEKFTTLDKVENNGLDLTGNFHTENWGDFITYFRFHLNSDGKFNRLDIGQR